MPRLPAHITDYLDSTGLPWEATKGARHIHVRIAGRLVSVLPYGKKTRNDDPKGRQYRNTMATIRRIVRRMRDEAAIS
jgi:hypothetical protein